MGDIPQTPMFHLRLWWYRHEVRILKIFIVACLLGMAFIASGCASMDYEWVKTRPASAKPWLYVTALDVDRACREFGANAKRGERINGCARWSATHCLILLPENSPAWIIAHEEKHCDGWTH